jgi:hypothetical protein
MMREHCVAPHNIYGPSKASIMSLSVKALGDSAQNLQKVKKLKPSFERRLCYGHSHACRRN